MCLSLNCNSIKRHKFGEIGPKSTRIVEDGSGELKQQHLAKTINRNYRGSSGLLLSTLSTLNFV